MVNYVELIVVIFAALVVPEVLRPAFLYKAPIVVGLDPIASHASAPMRNESPPFDIAPIAAETGYVDAVASVPGISSNAQTPLVLRAGGTYGSVYFSGCGFLLPFHFGVVAAFQDRGVSFNQAVGTSGGVMAALAMLGGADLDLGVAQCFDLREEPAAMPWVLQSFFAVYRTYFKAFRGAAAIAAFPLANLRGRLFVRLGKARWGLPAFLLPVKWEIFQVSDFVDEDDLADSFMSACYVPGATSFKPPGFRGATLFDAAFVDTFFTDRSSKAFGINQENDSIFPPPKSARFIDEGIVSSISSAFEADAAVDTAEAAAVRVVVVPNQPPSLVAAGLVVVAGHFKQLGDFFADRTTMRRGFVEGYAAAAGMVDVSHLSESEREALAAKVAGAGSYVDAVLARHAGWREKQSLPTQQTEHTEQLPDILKMKLPWPLQDTSGDILIK